MLRPPETMLIFQGLYMKAFIKSLEDKKHYELADIKSGLVREKLQAHRAGDKETALDLHRKIELVKVTMQAL